MKRPQRLILPLLAVAMVSGCAMPRVDEPVPEALAPYAADAPRRGRPIPDDAVLSPMKPWQWQYERVDAEKPGEAVTTWIEFVDDERAPIRRHVDPTRQVRHLTQPRPGWVALAGVTDHNQSVVTIFHDPLPVMRVDLVPGEPKTRESAVTVHPIGDMDSTIQKGTARMTIVHEADQVMKVPAGRFNTRRIRLTFESEMTFAKVRSVSVIHYAEGVGIVAEKSAKKIRAPFHNRDEQMAIVLTDKPRPRHPGDAAAAAAPGAVDYNAAPPGD